MDFVSSLIKLKNVPRSGWISHGVAFRDVESVADHSFAASALAMLLADSEVQSGRRVNVERVLRLALLHDLAETLTFDISKLYLEYLGTKGEVMKRELEEAAWRHMIKTIQNDSIRRNYAALVSEYNAEETVESQIVHAADRLELLFQIIEFHRRGYPKAMLADLWESSNRQLTEPQLPSVRHMQKVATRLYKAK